MSKLQSAVREGLCQKEIEFYSSNTKHYFQGGNPITHLCLFHIWRYFPPSYFYPNLTTTFLWDFFWIKWRCLYGGASSLSRTKSMSFKKVMTLATLTKRLPILLYTTREQRWPVNKRPLWSVYAVHKLTIKVWEKALTTIYFFRSVANAICQGSSIVFHDWMSWTGHVRPVTSCVDQRHWERVLGRSCGEAPAREL